MGIADRPGQRGALITALAGTAALVTALGIVSVVTGGSAKAQTPSPPQPDTPVVHAVGTAAQKAAETFWTSPRMGTATPAEGPVKASSPAAGPPPGTPTATPFDGVPTVGALFYTTGTGRHFCTASVVNSATANLVLTAAHCVYSSTYASNIEFVPGYYDGQQPYGAWPVQTITVAAGWQQSHDPDLDFAFLSVAPPQGTWLPIQEVTGGLWLGINRGYDHHIEVIGYNNTDNGPVRCATRSFEFEPNQMEFYCHDYWDGTSGGPWITGYHGKNGTGTVIGVIGGYEEGGDYEWASYSAYFGWPTLELFLQAEKQQA
jgi:V8-like Glu-specific endopeptidase